MRLALSLALPSAGSSNAARIAMIAMTTSSSISVKPLRIPADTPLDSRLDNESRAVLMRAAVID